MFYIYRWIYGRDYATSNSAYQYDRSAIVDSYMRASTSYIWHGSHMSDLSILKHGHTLSTCENDPYTNGLSTNSWF